MSVRDFINSIDQTWKETLRNSSYPYIKIAEYNEVVLAGREHSNGSFEFATWNYKNNSLYHGHYTTDYKGAREDFATRSGLVNKNLLFNKNELVEIYRCIEDTMKRAIDAPNATAVICTIRPLSVAPVISIRRVSLA